MIRLPLPFLKKGCAYNFKILLAGGFSEHFVECCSNARSGIVVMSRFNTVYYPTNYQDAIIQYHLACGCKVTKWEQFDSDEPFEIHYTYPTKGIDPEEWYRDVYRPRILISNSTAAIMVTAVICILLFALFVYYFKA